jgi:hypothetical protein
MHHVLGSMGTTGGDPLIERMAALKVSVRNVGVPSEHDSQTGTLVVMLTVSPSAKRLSCRAEGEPGAECGQHVR